MYRIFNSAPNSFNASKHHPQWLFYCLLPNLSLSCLSPHISSVTTRIAIRLKFKTARSPPPLSLSASTKEIRF